MHTFETIDDTEHVKKIPSDQPFNKSEEIKKLITNHSSNDPYLDLSNRGLAVIPSDLFLLAHIQHLYLEGNHLVELPDNFFDRLPALLWLDLRNNKLKLLPTSIGRHQSIKHLLLEGNQLQHLPLQMGMTKSLIGLNLQGNPLQHPPQHIIDQGVYVILSFLYQELQNRSRQTTNRVTQEIEKLQIKDDASQNSDEEILTEEINLSGRKIPSPMSDDQRMLRSGLAPVSASLHKPVTYQEYKGKFQSFGFSDMIRVGRLKNNEELSMLHLRQQSDARKEQLRAVKERQSAFADQRRKTYDTLYRKKNEEPKKPSTTPEFAPPVQGVNTTPIEIHSELSEEKVERVFPDSKLARRKRRTGRAWRNRINRADRFGSYSHYKHTARNVEEARELLAQLQSEAGEKMRENLTVFEDSYSRNGYISNSVAKKNDAIQQRIRQHSHRIHYKMKQMRGHNRLSNEIASSKEIQRQLLEDKIKEQMDVEYRFRAFTGDSKSTKSDSFKSL